MQSDHLFRKIGSNIRIDKVSRQDAHAAATLIFSHFTQEDQQCQVESLLADAYAPAVESSVSEPLPAALSEPLPTSSPTNLSTALSEPWSAASSSSAQLSTMLVGAWRNAELVGAACFNVQPGKTAMLWLPRLIVGEPFSTALHLSASIEQYLIQIGVRLIQVVLETDDEDANNANKTTVPQDVELLRMSGFRYLTHLHYMTLDLENSPSPKTEQPLDSSSPLQFVPYHENVHERFRKILESTYVGTDDCVGLEVGQDTEDLFVGYCACENWVPDHWLIVRHQQRDIGCLLLVDHPEIDMMEILYFGLESGSRGKGWARKILEHAKQIAGNAGRKHLATAVDDSNRRAIQSYISAGFLSCRRRQLYVKALTPGP
jgi:ribosomal protein S18 acetylase RimI-like enzyme